MVGSAVGRCLAQSGNEVLTVGHSALDLRNQSATEGWLKQNRPDAIVLAAAKSRSRKLLNRMNRL